MRDPVAQRVIDVPRVSHLYPHGVRGFEGLSQTEAARRLKQEGYNELPAAKRRGIFAIAHELVREPMFLLLVACGSIYYTLGDAQEALMLLGFVLLMLGITLYQEQKTEKTLEALRDLSSPRALVIRDGRQIRIAGREVARGDILVLAEGDRVPADAVILKCTSLLADESVLTGESVPVRKTERKADIEAATPGGDDLPFVYSGTLIVQGSAYAEACSTGPRTEIGKIGRALQLLTVEATPLQAETSRLVRNVAILAAALCAFTAIGYGFIRGGWVNGILAALTLAMAILPNEFPVVVSIFMVLGAWRISRKRVLTRRVSAIETLGSATVLCVDKTGTLTLNEMSVARLFADGRWWELNSKDDGAAPEAFHSLIEFGILASRRDPFDPMEKALKRLSHRVETEHIHDDWELVREYPLSQVLLALSRVWKSRGRDDYVIAAKGAPEAIADLCHFNEAQLQEMTDAVTAMSNEGLRVIGAARSLFKESDLPPQQHDFKFEFLGLIGLADPVRPTVRESIEECYQAGVRVVMITGDYPGTARSIARQIGLVPNDQVITGSELDQMEDDGLRERIRSVNIFARVVPEQKLRLVRALKANGEIVAMTGDGVNDAPALKAAHIGIAMGARGTDVAREAASLVLLDDDFSSIVSAVRLGRRIFDNLKKAMAYILAIHVPIAGMTLIPVFLNWPLVLMPVHIAFLHMIIDPACSIVFEAEPAEKRLMLVPPRDPGERLFGKRLLVVSLLQGSGVLVVLALIYGVTLRWIGDESEARALAFTTLIIANLGLILTNRSWSRTMADTLGSPNRALWLVVGGAIVFLALALYVSPLRRMFRFGALSPLEIGIALAAAAISNSWFEAFKKLTTHRFQRSDH